MSAHVPGCVWDRDRQCYTTMGDGGCAAPEEHATWKHPTWCVLCGAPIVYVNERHRCASPAPTPTEDRHDD